MVNLDDLKLKGLVDQAIEITDRVQVDLGARKKRFDPNVDHHPTLNAGQHTTLDHRLVFVGLFQILPDLHLVRFLLGQDQIALGILPLFDVDLNRVADLQDAQFLVGELIDRNRALRLISDIDDDPVFPQGDHSPIGDGPLIEIPEGLLVHGRQGHAIQLLLTLLRAHVHKGDSNRPTDVGC